jgi:hypothetical protein
MIYLTSTNACRASLRRAEIFVECGCGHSELLTAAMLATAGVPLYTKVLDLKRRLKCKACRWKGRAEVSVLD